MLSYLLSYMPPHMLHSSFYQFFPLPRKKLSFFQKEIRERGEGRIRGLFILAREGVNAGFCGPAGEVMEYQLFLNSLFQKNFCFKNFEITKWSCRRLSVKLKPEISAVGGPGLLPSKAKRLTAEEWDRESGAAQILDVRNHYEARIGRFQGAFHLQLRRFKEFPEKLRQASFLDKKRKTLIYCTGGIRCEKAQRIMEDQGFQKVFQLEGGILNYLKTHPHKRFQKECFVFDHRAALDQKLQPSKKYSLCPHCGEPGDLKILCGHCRSNAKICRPCFEKGAKACSKNCAYHFKMGHRFKGRKPAGMKTLENT